MAQTRWEADFEERALASYLPYVEGGGRQFGLLPGRGRRGGPGKDPRGNGPGGLGHQTQEEMKETMGGGGGEGGWKSKRSRQKRRMVERQVGI